MEPRRTKPPADARPAERRTRRRAAAEDAPLLRFLVQSAADLNSTLELEAVFRKVAERVLALIDCQLFCVMLWNERTRLLEHSFSLCLGERITLQGGFRLGQGISGSAASSRRVIRVAEVASDPRYVRERHPEVKIRSELAVPLVLKGRLIGVIDLESTEPEAFTEQHEQVLTALASHVASAVDNARLYERVRRDERRLELDLATAREIQKGLLPGPASRTDGVDVGWAYLSARELGGDFYDFQPYGDRRLAVAIGDVAGKGTAAALFGSLAVGMMRGQMVERQCGPAEMLARMNEQLHPRCIDNRFVALSFGVYDAQQRTLALANGGFTRPYLLRGGVIEKIDVRGVPLGLFPGVRYDELQLRLEPGDVVAFCSDGLQEAVNGVGEQFGAGDLEDIVCSLASASAQQIADGILRAGTAYVGVDEQHPDDRSVVVLKVR